MRGITTKQLKLFLWVVVLVVGFIGVLQISNITFGPEVAHAEVSVGGNTSTLGGDASSFTFSHTVGEGDNRLLIVGASLLDPNPDKKVESVTYGTTTMTEIADVGGSDIRIQLFEMVAPSVGTKDISVSIANNQKNKVGIGALNFFGVDQNNPTEGIVSNSGSQAVPSVNVASEVGDLAMDVLGTDKPLPAVGDNQVLRWSVEQEKDKDAGASTEEGSSSTIMSWGEALGKFTQVGFNINQYVSDYDDSGSGDQRRRVRFSGESYPDSEVYFLGITESGSVREVLSEPFKTTGDGSFDYTVFPDRTFSSFGVQVVDPEGEVTPVLRFDGRRLSDNRVVVEQIIPPPTLSLKGATVPRGESLDVSGYALKNSLVQLRIDGVITTEVSSDLDGKWSYELDKDELEFGSHAISVRHKEESQWSDYVDFYLSPLQFLVPDLNKDHKVNDSDLEIFLSRWREGQRSSLDMNGDNNVGIADFSIFLDALNN